MENIVKDILNYLGNTNTQVETKQDFKGNYYSYLTDTIYIAKDFENTKTPSAAKNINKKAAELVVVCHECIHSIQSKCMHILNTIFSNLSIVLALIYIITGMFWTASLWFKIATCLVILASIVIRLVLEVGAINGSIKLADDVVSKNIVDGPSQQDIQESKNYINKYKYIALAQMILDKIVFLILALTIK